MSNCMNECTHAGHQHKPNNIVCGNSVDIKITECHAAEVRADVIVQSAVSNGDKDCSVVRLWGQIKDCKQQPVPNALLKLVKVICTTNGTQYQGIAHTVSDCEGFYQFDLCYCDGTECYKILASKTYAGREQIIETGFGNCSPCTGEDNNSYQPCKHYDPIITPGGPAHKCGCPPCPPCPPYPPYPPCPPCPPYPPCPPCPPYPPCPPCPPCPPKPPCSSKQYCGSNNSYQGCMTIQSPCGQ